ncbi:DUF3060 domain-containing protein [Arthrobacter agilis]|uniref:DUF3060 domain-containing protein n=1 Tax=Arthrobacter agilis TaxID=37921 RepID=UPI000B35AD3D|nr:DUF3060 domain-containing protein [Arthrobacter agilis]OUM44727.1 hypothetical protein B8W74_02215 [Arthrobacter agilis]PPB47052.1 DUF3060 domain-containing protein [Arthrobacter agilis]TPV22467.1 DUF3060 domain-containing protein [Arthrobacter agilis]VDR32279.1 Protein of uncharacterised function (DUF3060) [Arthrobacter agilis]
MNTHKDAFTQVGLFACAVMLLTACSTGSSTAPGTVTPDTETSASTPMTGETDATSLPTTSRATSSATSDATPSTTALRTANPTASATGSASAGGQPAATISLVAGAEHKITGSADPVTVECTDGGDIDIEADNVDLTITGDCEDVEIDGDENTITGGNAETLDIEGDGNTVATGTVPEVSVDGDNNSVEVDETSDVSVEGDENTVTYQSGDPAIETEGNNSVSAA